MRKIEARIAAGDPAEDISADLLSFDEKVMRASFPISRAPGLYALKIHASLVAGRLHARGQPAAPGS